MDISCETVRSNIILEIEFLYKIAAKLFLYPFSGPKTGRLFWGYYLVLLLIIVTSAQLTVDLYLTGFKSLIQITDIAPNIGVCVVALMKYIEIRRNRDFYQSLILHFQDEIWIVGSEEPKYKEIIIKFTFATRVMCRGLYYYCLLLICVVDSLPWIVTMLEIKILGKKNFSYLYPYDGWYPMDKVEWYHLVYFWESLMTMIVVLVHAFANMLHFAVISFMCMELKLIGIALADLITDEDIENIRNKTLLISTHHRIKQKLRDSILRHEYLVRSAKYLDGQLGSIMSINYALGSVFICLTAFSSTVVSRQEAVKYVAFFLSLICDMGAYCLLGQFLSDHSVHLSEDIYSSQWIYADESTKKTLILFLAFTQRPFKLTANGYSVMNLNSFTSICSTAYQFFNLLRTVYEK